MPDRPQGQQVGQYTTHDHLDLSGQRLGAQHGGHLLGRVMGLGRYAKQHQHSSQYPSQLSSQSLAGIRGKSHMSPSILRRRSPERRNAANAFRR
jgi:hypothetical protein